VLRYDIIHTKGPLEVSISLVRPVSQTIFIHPADTQEHPPPFVPPWLTNPIVILPIKDGWDEGGFMPLPGPVD